MVKNFAHRGYSAKYPENTMLAFKKAVQAGSDGIELDVQLSKDGELVIIHDESLDRTTGVDGNVQDYYYKDLRKFNASANHKSYGFNQIPSLREYLEYIKDKDIITNVELKTDVIEYLGIEKKVLELIYEYDLKDKILLSSFNPNTMLRVKEMDNEIKCSILTKKIIRNPLEYVRKLGVDGYHPVAYFIRRRTVKKLRDNGIIVNVWTGERKYSLKRLLGLKTDGIITDYTEELNSLIK